MQNKPNYKGRIQNTEDRIQSKKLCITICPIKDCAIIFPVNPLDAFRNLSVAGKKRSQNEANFKAEYRTQYTEYRSLVRKRMRIG